MNNELKEIAQSFYWRVGHDLRVIEFAGQKWPFSYDGASILGQRLHSLGISTELIESCQKALNGEAQTFEQWIANHLFLFTVTPVNDESGSVIGVDVIAADISQYKKSEADIKVLKHHAESILNAAGEGIYGLNLEGKATFVNPAAERMTGWSAAEMIGHSIHYLHHHSHEDGTPYPQEECPIYAAIRDGVIHHIEGEVFWRKDGTCFPVEYTSTPIYENGKLAGAVAVFKDTTVQKKAKKDLLEAFDEVAKLKEQLEEQNNYLQEEIREELAFGEVVGTSLPVRRMLEKIEHVAPTDASVLVLGESGTGKELIAHAVHENSRRRDHPLVKVNCGTLSSSLVESELFGHEKGAFTGAHDRRRGRFELADGGTLFLDEVGELPLDTQVKLLRVLQEQEFERLGGEKLIRVNVRIIAATNRDLAQLVEEGSFRNDLYYRLNVFPIEAPALRERHEDVALLAKHFLSCAARKFGKTLTGFSGDGLARLEAYDWPGNIRELKNVIERAAILATMSSVDVISLIPKRLEVAGADSQQLLTLAEVERAHIERILMHTRGIISGTRGAAAVLSMHPNTLRSRMIKLGINIIDVIAAKH